MTDYRIGSNLNDLIKSLASGVVDRDHPLFRRLDADIDAALDSDGAKDECGHCGVNWGDLQCVDITLCIPVCLHKNDNPFLRVLIEEASPSAWELGRYVIKFLQDRGWQTDLIHIDMEW